HPRDGDKKVAVAEERDRHSRPEDAEVPVPKRRKQVTGGKPYRAVERFVTMLHWTPACCPRPSTPGARRESRTRRRNPSGGRRGTLVRSRSRGRGASLPAREARCPLRQRRARGSRRAR